MDVAIVSVIASAAVALLTIGATVVGGERQRRHEADLDFERRVWERKSEALFTVIQECRVLADSDLPVSDENRLHYALDMSRTLDKLHGARPAVEAFASSRCRRELTDLIEALDAGGVRYDVGRRADQWRKKLTEVDPATDTRAWDRYRKWQKETEDEAVTDFDPDMENIRARAEQLLDAARQSVRRPKD